MPRNIDWTAYHRVNDIYAWLDQMAATHQNTSVRTIGRTFEGRDIKLFSITRNPVNKTQKKYRELENFMIDVFLV